MIRATANVDDFHTFGIPRILVNGYSPKRFAGGLRLASMPYLFAAREWRNM